mgnify:CR=1 FL=1
MERNEWSGEYCIAALFAVRGHACDLEENMVWL